MRRIGRVYPLIARGTVERISRPRHFGLSRALPVI